MSTLYIRHPSRASFDSVQADAPLACPFALVSDSGAIERQGTAPLPTLSAMIDAAYRVVVLLAASDVSLLRVKLPPLSAPKLKAALPNLVEDQLISDPTECVVVAAPGVEGVDGMRAVAVVQRTWLLQVVGKLQALGARNIVALPAQLCLPPVAEGVAAAVGEAPSETDAGIDLTLRLSAHEGVGVPVLPDEAAQAASDVLHTLRALVPQAPVQLYVPQAQLAHYEALAAPGVVVAADAWQRWIAGARATPLDLMAGLAGGGNVGFDWARWRWPLALAAAILVVHIGSLNYEWWHDKKEADGLRAAMTQAYTALFPKDPVSDPLAQMNQKLAAAKVAGGQSAPADFAVLTAAFGEAWSGVMQGRPVPGIAGIDYKERALLVHFKPGAEAPLAEMKAALAARNQVLTPNAPDLWQIKPGR